MNDLTTTEPPRARPAKSLDYWFDYTCPFAYLGSTQARAVATRMGVPLTYRPMLLGGVFRANGVPQNLTATLAPAKAAHNLEDMQRWAARFGVPLRMPANHPMRSVDALRTTLVTGLDPKVIDAIYRAYWVDNEDVASHDVLRRVLEATGHDPARVLAAIGTEEVKDDLRRRTEEAIALGIFGVPAWVVDGTHLYWGQDRIPLVEGVPPALPARTPPASRTLDVYWDFSSPFAYLGVTAMADVARRIGARVNDRPMLLGGLFRAIGQVDVPLAAFSAAKQRHTFLDLHRWAVHRGIPFRFPSRFPTNSLRALRVWFALPEARRAAYRDAVFRAYWAEDQDITDDAVLARCVGDEAAARDAFAKATSDDVKAALRNATDAAVAEGVFGAPTFIVSRDPARGLARELFWGQDRVELAVESLVQ